VVEQARQARHAAVNDANISRYVLLGIVLLLILLVVFADLACRGRIGRSLDEAQAAGRGWEIGS
jgi:hypothetical protein